MLNINKADVEQLVEIMEYILEKEGTVSVEKLMKDNGLTFEEYRLVSALTMPAIRRKNDFANMKAKAAYFKGVYLKEKYEREKTEEVLQIAKEYLDRKLSQKQKAVIKNSEQEAEENGNSDDTSGNDEESDNTDR